MTEERGERREERGERRERERENNKSNVVMPNYI
jgi:hypothetical protein